MPEPIIDDHYRALVTIPAPSGLPADQIVHTFHFRNDELGVEPFGTFARMLDGFYTTVGPAGGSISSLLDDAYGPPTYTFYDLGETPPRTPRGTTIAPAWDCTGNAEALPPEMAAVISLRTAERSRRGRGRLYMGPLTITAVDEGRISQSIVGVLHAGADNLVNSAENGTWGVLSRLDAVVRPITGGYVDDAWDVQRRRDPGALSRLKFGSYEGP